MASPLHLDRDTYEINGVRVTLIRHESGARWECDRCAQDCSHILIAAAWITVQSWAGSIRDIKPH